MASCAPPRQLLLLLLLLPLSVVTSLSYVGVGATGALGRKWIDSVSSSGSDVLVLARNGFLASAPGRVSHDFGYLGPKLMRKSKCKVRDWDGGDMLDITGSTWVGWQGDVESYGCDVAVCLTGCLYEARIMAVDRMVTALGDMPAKKGRPKMFINVLPESSIIKSPKGKENVAAAAEAATKLSAAGVKVVNVKMGRVVGLKTDPIEANMYQNMYYSVGGGGMGSPKDGGVAWVHADDAVRALDVIATSPAFLAEGGDDASSATTVVLDASKPFQSAQLEAAGFSYEYTDLKNAQPPSSGLV